MPEDRRPNWDKWKLVPDAKLWEAAALSLNIAPEKVRFAHRRVGRVGPPPVFFESREFDDRLFVVIRNFGADSWLTPTSVRDSLKSTVSLPLFATWAAKLKLDIPEEFLKLAEKVDDVPNEHGSWPWGDHDTYLLQQLAAAAREHWAGYDPNRPKSAPKNATVIKWLEERGVSKRTAQVMASILRHDKLPPGPRK